MAKSALPTGGGCGDCVGLEALGRDGEWEPFRSCGTQTGPAWWIRPRSGPVIGRPAFVRVALRRTDTPEYPAAMAAAVWRSFYVFFPR